MQLTGGSQLLRRQPGRKIGRYMLQHALDVIKKSVGHGGFAIGTGNSIPNYLPAESYLNMVEIVREYRGDWTHR